MKSNEFKSELSGITCYFVGNAHDFSEPAIELATISFKSVRFERLETIEDLLSLDVDRVDRVRSIILNQSMGESFSNSIDQIQDKFPSATTAFAYRQPELARSFLIRMKNQRPKRGVGFLPMNRDLDRWLTVLRLLVRGENYVPGELYDDFFSGADVAAAHERPPAPSEPEPSSSKPRAAGQQRASKAGNIRLTTREAQVLSCVAEGKQNKLIANRLGLSEHTVKLHIHHVIAKLGVNNRTEAAVWFLENHGSDQFVQ
ncbi:response regulator transcription factor [Tritonibacter sp. AK171]|uniref:helix-turn-helix transcriptional regulator n=1 Tax=Tritonibacter sp. AK171 TaxID=3048493 RepID=UPI0024C2211D|nr:response regulator transcription factor [Tritonibacter sp. AK171]